MDRCVDGARIHSNRISYRCMAAAVLRCPQTAADCSAFGFGATGITMAEKIGYYTKLHIENEFIIYCGNSLPVSDFLYEKNMRTVF